MENKEFLWLKNKDYKTKKDIRKITREAFQAEERGEVKREEGVQGVYKEEFEGENNTPDDVMENYEKEEHLSELLIKRLEKLKLKQKESAISAEDIDLGQEKYILDFKQEELQILANDLNLKKSILNKINNLTEEIERLKKEQYEIAKDSLPKDAIEVTKVYLEKKKEIQKYENQKSSLEQNINGEEEINDLEEKYNRMKEIYEKDLALFNKLKSILDLHQAINLKDLNSN